MDILMKSSSFPKRVSILVIVSAVCGALAAFFWIAREGSLPYGVAFLFTILIALLYRAFLDSFLVGAEESRVYIEFSVAVTVLVTVFAMAFGAYYAAMSFIGVVAILGTFRALDYLSETRSL